MFGALIKPQFSDAVVNINFLSTCIVALKCGALSVTLELEGII